MWLVLEPIFTAALSAIILDDSMTIWEVLASALTCTGLVIVLSQIDLSAEKPDPTTKVASSEETTTLLPLPP